MFEQAIKNIDENPEIILQENDILICKDGAGIGKVGIVNVTGCVREMS